MLDYEILCQHFCESTSHEKHVGKVNESIDTLIGIIRPVKHERFKDVLHITIWCSFICIGEIFRLNRVGHNKKLNIAEQPLKGLPSITINLVNCLVDFNARALKFHLDKWQAIDKHGYVVSVFLINIIQMRLIHSDLM